MFYSINLVVLLVFICILQESKQFHLFDDNDGVSHSHNIFKRQSCSSTEFKCNNGQCIERYKACDGTADCNDSSDENVRQCKDVRCPSYTFRCNYGACIDKLGECNGVKDCVDNSDEQTIKCPKRCRNFEFECKDGKCIPGYEKCDGKRNCDDGSDETVEACSKQKCQSIFFRCRYGACIDSMLKCNNVKDCADGSDEDPETCPQTAVITPRPTTPTIPTSGACVLPEFPYGGSYSIYGQRDYPNPGNLVRDGTVLQYKCLKNYVLMPSPYAVCANGAFSPSPICEITCPARISPSIDLRCEYGGREVNCAKRDQLLNGTVLKMDCKKYFHLKYANQKKSTVCKDGTWGVDLIECEPDCGDIVGRAQEYAIGAVKTQIVEYPWHIGIYRHFIVNDTYEHICGGNIINPRVILSVAHCFTDANGGFVPEYENKQVDFYIAAGKVYREYNDPRDRAAEKRKVIDIRIPPQYKGYTLHYSHDVALLELEEELPRNNIIRSICLDYDYELHPNSIGTVVGWGLTEKDGSKGDPQLRKLTIPFIEKEECFNKVPDDYKQFLVHDHICAGLTNGSSVCQGDSGGGLVFPRDKRFVLIGLVSNGPVKDDICDWNQVAAYTEVKKHKDFIDYANKLYEKHYKTEM